jgi:diaminopimelate decarboxylase
MLPEQIETPAYVYDLAVVRDAYARLCGQLPEPSSLLYSVKANPHPDILATLHAVGAGAEVCSPGELAAAVDAGFDPGSLLYSGPAKRDVDVSAALKLGVSLFSVDSPNALDQLDRLARDRDVSVSCLVRVNDERSAPGQRLMMSGGPSQFGADRTWILSEPEGFRHRPAVRVAGFHLYMGSNVSSEDHLLAQFERAIDTARHLHHELGISVQALNLGGGFGAPYARPGILPTFPRLRGRVAAALDAAFPAWRHSQPRVLFESGRYLTATCGQLVVRVLDVKCSQGRTVVILESGINHLGGMSGLRRIPEIAAHPQTDAASRPRIPELLLTGPLCTPLDVWSHRGTGPYVRPGELLTIPNVGSYGLYASLLAFLGHPCPVEVTVDDGVRTVTRLMITRERFQ